MEVEPEHDRWRVRICDIDGAVLGAGILLGDQHVLTCAHLLRQPDDLRTAAPDTEVIIDFIGLLNMPSATARVADGGWVPPNDADGGDIALLELAEPLPTGSTTPLRRQPVKSDRAVRICGFPRGFEDGLWVHATPSGPSGELVQMDVTSKGGPVRGGFSGAPVFDKTTQGVIGIVVSAVTDDRYGLAYMLPVETIIGRLKSVEQWASGPKATDPTLVRPGSMKLDKDLARKIVSWIQRYQITDNIQIIITGSSDSSEHATLLRAIRFADREQRPRSTDPLVTQSPEWTIPPPGGIDLAVDATDRTPGEVFQRIADRASLPVEQPTKPTSELLDSLPPMTIVMYGIDDSEDPETLLTQVIEPLAERGQRLLLAFRRELSESLSIAQSHLKTWMCAGLVPLPVLDLPDPTTKVLADPALSAAPKLAKGDLVAKQYEIVGCVARGGLGWVYLAKDTHLDGNYVALKAQITRDVQSVAREVAERRFLTTLNHPNIVRIFNFVTHPDPESREETGYIVMEYVGGRSLHEIRDIAAGPPDPKGEPLLVEEIIGYGIEILDALDYLHNHGLLYCDMKPSNVIRSSNRIKVIDLGAVRRINNRQMQSDGTTVRFDVAAVGTTLQDLLSVSEDMRRPATDPDVSFGIESFRRALERATHQQENRRFPSAAAMSQQLRGVLREVLALRDGQPRPDPFTLLPATANSMFTVTAKLLDAGLGMVPPLAAWTTRPAGLDATLDTARPSASVVAISLPVPQVATNDPAVSFLATVSTTTDLRLLIEQLATSPHESAEVQFRSCRAHLELKQLETAGGCLSKAEKILGDAADYDWSMAWHRGLLALAHDDIDCAATQFTNVYRALPGEDTPKLALGFCYEESGKLDNTERYYDAVWRRDRAQASAAFGLARVCLQRSDRNGAVAILDKVPEISRHNDAAKIAVVRILSGRLAAASPEKVLPTVADLRKVVSRLPTLNLDGGEKSGPSRDRLTAAVREVALAWVREAGDSNDLKGYEILGENVTQRKLGELLEESFRKLAGQASNANERGILIDRANTCRVRTLW